MKWESLALAVTLVLVACSKPTSPSGETIRWSNYDSDTPPPAILYDSSFSQTHGALNWSQRRIEYAEQKLGPAYIKNGSLHLVYKNQKNVQELLNFRLQSGFDIQTRSLQDYQKAQELFDNREIFLNKIKQKHSLIRQGELVDEIRVMYDPNLGAKAFYYAIRFIPSSQDQIRECEILLNFAIRNCYRISSDFQAPAWIYTLESWNQLQEVLLANLKDLQQGALHSSTHWVRSASPHVVQAQDFPFRYGPEDPRFDQVQVFHWVDHALTFMRAQWNFSLDEPIEIATFLGYPSLTNSAIAYRNQIRIGRGDGESFQYFAQDPSIIIHEVGHVLIHHLAHLPQAGEGGSLNEAFADYFAATIIGSPYMAERSYLKGPYKRNLDQSLSYLSRQGKLYADSLIISSTLWEIEKTIGAPLTRQLFMELLIELGPAQSLAEFAPALLRVGHRTLAPDTYIKIQKILNQRQF